MEINKNLSVKLGPNEQILVQGHDGGTVRIHGLACGGVEVITQAPLLKSHLVSVRQPEGKQAVAHLTLTKVKDVANFADFTTISPDGDYWGEGYEPAHYDAVMAALQKMGFTIQRVDHEGTTSETTVMTRGGYDLDEAYGYDEFGWFEIWCGMTSGYDDADAVYRTLTEDETRSASRKLHFLP